MVGATVVVVVGATVVVVVGGTPGVEVVRSRKSMSSGPSPASSRASFTWLTPGGSVTPADTTPPPAQSVQSPPTIAVSGKLSAVAPAPLSVSVRTAGSQGAL